MYHNLVYAWDLQSVYIQRWHTVTGYTSEYIDTASIPSSIGPEVAIIKHLTSVRLAAADLADLDHNVHTVSCTINNIFNVLAQVILIPSPVFFFGGSYIIYGQY